MQSPILMQSAILPHPYQAVQIQDVYLQQGISVPAVAQYPVTLLTSASSSIDIIQASVNFPSEATSCLLHTHASYSQQPIPELANSDCGNWALTLSVPIPEDMVYPTLTSFSYTIKYSTANDRCASVIQSHILLTVPESEAISAEVSASSNAKGNYRDGITVTPQTFEGTTAMRLLSVQGIKKNDVQGQWSHFVDRQQIPLNVRIVQSSRLCLQFHVSEHPTAATLRSLSVDVSATWLDDQEGRRLIEELHEAEICANNAEAQAAAEEAARATAEAQQAADEKAKEEAERKLVKVADEKVQEKIKKALNNLPESRRCPNGYAWIQQPDSGYTCSGGGHHITWEELNSA